MNSLLPLLPPVIAALVSAAAILLAARIARATSRETYKLSIFQFLFGIWKQELKEQERLLSEVASSIPEGRKQNEAERAQFLSSAKKLQISLLIRAMGNERVYEMLDSLPENERSSLEGWNKQFTDTLCERFLSLESTKAQEIRLQIEDKSK